MRRSLEASVRSSVFSCVCVCFPLCVFSALVATIHFSLFRCCFRRRSFTGIFRNENAKFTESLLCWDPAGLVWHGKRPKAGNGKKKMEIEMAPSWKGAKMAKKMAKNWIFEGVFHYFPFFGPFFGHFCPLSSLGPFSISIFIFFSISGFWPLSMPYQPGRIPTLMFTIHCLDSRANGSLITPITLTYSRQSRE